MHVQQVFGSRNDNRFVNIQIAYSHEWLFLVPPLFAAVYDQIFHIWSRLRKSLEFSWHMRNDRELR